MKLKFLCVRSASLPNFSIVPVMPLPISAARLANSDRPPFFPWASPLRLPLAALFSDSVSNDCLDAPTFVVARFFCAWARTALNSIVLSWIEEVTMSAGLGGLTPRFRGSAQCAHPKLQECSDLL